MARKSPLRATSAIIAWANRGAALEDIDTSLIPDSYQDGVLVGPRPAAVVAEHEAKEFTERFSAGADCFKLNRNQSQALKAIIGKGGMPARMLLSCIPTRLQLTTQLSEQWRNHWHLHRREPSRQYMFITVITDSGNVLTRRPEVYLEALRRRIDKLLREANLQANFVIEVQLVTNFPRQGHGGTHCWHGHCVVTTDDPTCNIQKLQSKLRRSGRLSNIFGAPTVTITPITGLAHLLRCCTYILKAPVVGKRLVPHPAIPAAWTFKKVFIRKDEALRLGEALSQLEFGQVVHSVGEGKHLLRPAMKAVRAWHKARYAKARNKLPKDFDIAKFWAGLRRSRANNRYGAYVFQKPRNEKHLNEWVAVAEPALKAFTGAREGASGPKALLRADKPRTYHRKPPIFVRSALDRVRRHRP